MIGHHTAICHRHFISTDSSDNTTTCEINNCQLFVPRFIILSRHLFLLFQTSIFINFLVNFLNQLLPCIFFNLTFFFLNHLVKNKNKIIQRKFILQRRQQLSLHNKSLIIMKLIYLIIIYGFGKTGNISCVSLLLILPTPMIWLSSVMVTCFARSTAAATCC